MTSPDIESCKFTAMPNNKAPETGACVVCGVVLACGEVLRGASVLRWSAWPRRAGCGRRPGRARVAFPARARRVSGARASGARAFGARASGAGDAVNGKYEKKTVTVDAPRYRVVLVDTNLGSADMYEALNQNSRVKI